MRLKEIRKPAVFFLRQGPRVTKKRQNNCSYLYESDLDVIML